jgi:putative DNA methylase
VTLPAFPKRLIEVDLPIKRISEHARREKSIRHGHISTLHIWWARRPLAACRAIICAALWPDPADLLCPQKFRDEASRLINNFARKAATDKEVAAHCSHENWEKWQRVANAGGLDSTNAAHWNVLRFALLDFISDFANWDNSTASDYLETSRALTQAAHEALGGAPGTRPLVVDPFAGGGSIPLEALRVGADAFASDLNPVAVLLNKVVLEYIPEYGQRLADEVRKWGEWIKLETEKDLAKFYPKDADGATPLAYLWARTIKCEGPGCGAEIPLVRSAWIAKKGSRAVALLIKPDQKRHISVSVQTKGKFPADMSGTVKRSSATCPCCGYTTTAENVRAQFKNRRGGADDARMLAVITTAEGQSGRCYRDVAESDLRAARTARELAAKWEQDYPESFPTETLPYLRSIFNINLLGVDRWRDLFSSRQLLAIVAFNSKVIAARDQILRHSNAAFADAVATCLALVVGRQIDKLSSLARWDISRENAQGTFGRQALGIVWDFNEVNPFSGSGGDWDSALNWVALILERESQAVAHSGHVECASATAHPLPDDSASAFITDPPYYDAIPYADLSDFFYVWLKRSIKMIHPELFKDVLSPKKLEVVQLAERNKEYSYKTKERFESLMRQAMEEGRRITMPSGLGVIVFAHKETAAWEVMLQAVIDAGWIVVASWPIDTEMGSRLRAMNSATLSSSVHLVCRPRENSEGARRPDDVGDWRDVLSELPTRIHEWMPRLAAEKVVGADAIFACLGPALEIFSRYARVEKASGEQVTLKDYLEYVWAAVAKEALNMIFEGADATGFEEDARLTAMWLWTLSTGVNGDGVGGTDEGEEDEDSDKKPKMSGFVLEYDAARKIAQGLGAHLEQLSSLVEVSGDKARLLPVSERAQHLFGKNEGAAPTKRKGKPKQLSLLDVIGEADESEEGWGEKNASRLGNTVLDRIHQSMILFAAGRGEALRRFLVTDAAGQDQRFWRLAQALSALYPKGTDERRWVEGVLARKKGLGF